MQSPTSGHIVFLISIWQAFSFNMPGNGYVEKDKTQTKAPKDCGTEGARGTKLTTRTESDKMETVGHNGHVELVDVTVVLNRLRTTQWYMKSCTSRKRRIAIGGTLWEKSNVWVDWCRQELIQTMEPTKPWGLARFFHAGLRSGVR